MKRWLPGLLCLVLSGAALAAGPAAVRKRVQASMLVTGSIEVASDGSVKQYSIDHLEKLPAGVSKLIGEAVPQWKFAPVVVNGKPAIATAPMSLRVVAKPLGDGKYSISVAGVAFSAGGDTSGETITWKDRVPPVYPRDAVDAHVSGTVYVLARVDRQGKVAEAMARQVNLSAIGSDAQMAAWRRVLADAALRAARRWTYNVPTVGASASAPYWQVNIPVAFNLSGPYAPAAARNIYGHWRPYVPGPVNQVPWADKGVLAGSADAVPEGGLVQPNPWLHLRTPIKGG